MAPFVTVGKVAVFYYFGLYKILWKYAGIDEVINVFTAVAFGNGLTIIAIYLLQLNVPRSIYVIATFLDFFFIGISRFTPKLFRRITFNDIIGYISRKNFKKVMVIGAGEAGGLLIQGLKNNPRFGRLPVCAIDDNEQKLNKKLNGVPIVGNRKSIKHFTDKYKIDEIIIAIPSIKPDELKDIVYECRKTNCELKILPSTNEIHDFKGEINELLVRRMRNISIEDLLGREQVELDLEQISRYIRNKTILVTGGGGSIGAEICRRVSRYGPEKLVIFDISENNLYEIQKDLEYLLPDLNVELLVGTIRDRKRVFNIFDKFRPNIVFHAAAHKHVPLMEFNPGEAVKNNIFGTLNLVQAAGEYGVEKFILISSDKAVNPTNVMGASKRVCEMIIQAYNGRCKTEFAAVRFGNVLGSKGSVVPLFKKQIERGGPVTVTHPDVIRYFMSTSEAVQLVIQAGAMARGGEIFILNMGEPVRIEKLARDLIRLSGLEPDRDIEIIYTGLRPGEKLFEELVLNDENAVKTRHSKIFISRLAGVDYNYLTAKLQELEKYVDYDERYVKKILKELVPNYRVSD
jgi:FlaA1/EpsC-like NDP-sugar epimerase